MKTTWIKTLTAEELPENTGRYIVKLKDAEDYHETYWFDASPVNISFWMAYVEYWLKVV